MADKHKTSALIKDDAVAKLKSTETLDKRNVGILILFFVVLAIGIISGGYYYYHNYEKHYRAEVERQISAIAQMKVDELVNWRGERLWDASIFYKNSAFSTLVRRFFENPQGREAQRDLRSWFDNIQSAQFDRVSLFDARGAERMSAPDAPESIAPHLLQNVSEVMRSGKIVFLDFHHEGPGQPIHLSILVPVSDGREGSKPIGILVFRIDPYKYIYPFINRWPTPSLTAETLLVRRDGNDALFLNELRFQKNAALNLRIPLTSLQTPAVKSVLGQEGIVEGVDYRGVPVISSIRSVPDSPWFLVARIDASEVYAPLREKLWEIIILIVTLLIGAAIGTVIVWRHQHTSYYREKLEAAEASSAELKQSAKVLMESEERYRNLFENAHDMIQSVDRDGHFIFVNSAWLKIMGYTPDELQKITLFDILHPTCTPHCMEAFQAIMSGKSLHNIDAIFVSKDGRSIDVQGNVAPRFIDGEIAGSQGIFRDITEQKRADEAVRKNSEKYRSIFENIQDIYYETALDGTVLEVSPSIEIVSKGQYKRDYFIGKSMLDFYANPKERDTLLMILQKQGRVSDMEITLKNRDGSLIPCSISAMLKYDADGKPTKLVGSMRDITERKKAEEERHESEEKYRTLVENVNIGIYRRTSGMRGRFLQVNPAMAVIFGYASVDEFMNIFAYEIYQTSEDNDKFMQKIREHGFVKGEEMRFKRKDGTPIWCSVTANIHYDDKSRSEWIDGVVEEITERKNLLNQLIQSQKMEAIGQLAGGISHDFNNILTAIIGYGHMLQIKLTENDTLRTYADHILSLSDRAATLTQSLLAFSRKQVMNPKSVQLNEIIRAAEKFLSRVIGEVIQLQTTLSEKDMIIMADHVQIEQVLMNLAANARDAMPEGGKLTIVTENTVMDPAFISENGFGKEGEYALISVTDTGTGMDKVTSEKIFEPFFTTKEVGKGTGLGLAMAYGIVKQHGGYITVYSEPGKGTTFRIYLPLIHAKAEEIRPEVIQPIQKGTETILLAEDEAEVRIFTKKLLEEYGYKVIDAVDGDDAISKFKSHKDKIQLALLDVLMPNRTGREVCDAIRKIVPDIKILFTSGYPAEYITERIQQGTELISKPIAPTTLLKKIREVLDK